MITTTISTNALSCLDVTNVTVYSISACLPRPSRHGEACQNKQRNERQILSLKTYFGLVQDFV